MGRRLPNVASEAKRRHVPLRAVHFQVRNNFPVRLGSHRAAAAEFNRRRRFASSEISLKAIGIIAGENVLKTLLAVPFAFYEALGRIIFVLALEPMLQQAQRQHHFRGRSLKGIVPTIPSVEDQAAD